MRSRGFGRLPQRLCRPRFHYRYINHFLWTDASGGAVAGTRQAGCCNHTGVAGRPEADDQIAGGRFASLQGRNRQDWIAGIGSESDVVAQCRWGNCKPAGKGSLRIRVCVQGEPIGSVTEFPGELCNSHEGPRRAVFASRVLYARRRCFKRHASAAKPSPSREKLDASGAALPAGSPWPKTPDAEVTCRPGL